MSRKSRHSTSFIQASRQAMAEDPRHAVMLRETLDFLESESSEGVEILRADLSAGSLRGLIARELGEGFVRRTEAEIAARKRK